MERRQEKKGRGEVMTTFHIIPDLNCPEETLRFSKEQNVVFEYNDFIFPDMLDDAKGVEDRIALYRSLGRDMSKDTMHGAFFDVTVFSYDAKVREISRFRMRQSMEIAKKMGLRGVVFHGNYLPFLKRTQYDANWLSYTEEVLRELAAEYPETEIYLENMFETSPDLLGVLAERLADVKKFGICLDYSHALLSSKDGKPWFDRLSKYIRHIHVNDHCFDGDVHMIPGEGQTDWAEFFRLREAYAKDATIHCEVAGIEAAKKGIAFLRSYL